jgi:hypothetical protein
LLAATSVSLAIFTFFSRRWESAIRNPDTQNGRPRPAQAIDVGLVHPTGPQGAPPPYAPAPPPATIYVIPQVMPIPMQPYAPLPPPMPQMGHPPPPASPRPPVTIRVPPLVRLNDLQLLVHQQQNVFTEHWEEYSPREFPTKDTAFVIFARHQRLPLLPSTIFLIEICSESLKSVLKGCDCLKYVESVFDPRPRVLQYPVFQS